MISPFGVEHSWVSKAAWKAFYPVPPKVGKIPRGRLVVTTAKNEAQERSVHLAALKHRPKRNIGSLAVDHGQIEMVNVGRGFRRRGVAANLMHEARKGGPAAHSPHRTPLGEKFAQGESAKQGTKPIGRDRTPGEPGSPMETQRRWPERKPYVSDHGVQPNHAYRARTVARVRRGR